MPSDSSSRVTWLVVCQLPVRLGGRFPFSKMELGLHSARSIVGRVGEGVDSNSSRAMMAGMVGMLSMIICTVS